MRSRSVALSRCARRRMTMRAKQTGVVLVVALVVLAVMTIAAVGLLRSVDTSTLFARNISFKRDATTRAELAVQRAQAFFATGGTFEAKDELKYQLSYVHNAGLNYSATTLTTDERGVPNILKSLGSAENGITANINAVQSNVDGMTVYYVVDRFCSVTHDAASADPEVRAPSPRTCRLSTRRSRGTDTRERQAEGVYAPLFRVTVRVDGPRGTTSYAQSVFAIDKT